MLRACLASQIDFTPTSHLETEHPRMSEVENTCQDEGAEEAFDSHVGFTYTLEDSRHCLD